LIGGALGALSEGAPPFARAALLPGENNTSVCAVPPGRFQPDVNHARAEGLPSHAPSLCAKATAKMLTCAAATAKDDRSGLEE
jgi:hypothetical protein